MDSPQQRHQLDVALDALVDPYRRQLLVAMLSHKPQKDDELDPLDIATDEERTDVLKIELVHKHLPKLAHRGYITWDRTTNEISKGPDWDEIAPLLEIIQDHQDELPEGWL